MYVKLGRVDETGHPTDACAVDLGEYNRVGS